MNYAVVDRIIEMALQEDGYYGDITTEALVQPDSRCRVELIGKETGILAGSEVFTRVFKKLSDTSVEWYKRDGERIEKGDILAVIEGDTRVCLTGERTALNILQRMCGIATKTGVIVEKIRGEKAEVVCTRKTTPGLRALEKYAVRAGGGVNHRFSLSDGIMIKDNHIRAAGGIENAVKRAFDMYPYMKCIEVETETLEEVEEALKTKAHIIMLDNMSIEDMRKAVHTIKGRKITEASGNIGEDNILEVAKTGVDFISSGSLTHSVKSLDLTMKNLKLL